jgi:multidrug transporter EmrE-like cation transporter
MPSPPDAPAPVAPLPWYWRPYLHLTLSILFSAAAQPLLKVGVDQVHLAAANAPGWQKPLFWLSNGWVWLGIGSIIASLVGWLQALKTVPLNIAFNLAGFTHVLVPLSSLALLGEHISPLRWAGILLVGAGVVITAKEAVRLEEKL